MDIEELFEGIKTPESAPVPTPEVLPAAPELPGTTPKGEPSMEDTIQDLLDRSEPTTTEEPRKAKPRLHLDFPSLLDDSEAATPPTEDETLDELPVEDAVDSAIDAGDSILEPPTITPPRPRRRTNYPTTLDHVIGDDDEVNACEERQFCDEVWRCAGGRNQSWFNRAKRDCGRDHTLRTKDNGGWLSGMICSSCGNNCGGTCRQAPGGLGGIMGAGIGHMVSPGWGGTAILTPSAPPQAAPMDVPLPVADPATLRALMHGRCGRI